MRKGKDMFGKVIKGILLAGLVAFYVIYIKDSGNDVAESVLYDKISFVLIVCILFLGSAFVRILKPLAYLVVLAGVIFHGYMYFQARYTSVEFATNEKAQKCNAKNATWYTKLRNNCY